MRRYYSLLALGFLFFILFLQNCNLAIGLTTQINDAENDVYFLNSADYSIKKTSLHDEIDIKTLSINGQNINLTFYGNVSTWYETENITNGAIIALYDDFDWDYYKTNRTVPFPYYGIQYRNWSFYLGGLPSMDFDVYLSYFQDEYNEFFWNGTHFVEDLDEAISIGYATEKSIVATVPSDGFEILDNCTILTQSIYSEIFGFFEVQIYTDIAPEKFNLFITSESSIPGFDILIFICTILGITLIIMKKQMKK